MKNIRTCEFCQYWVRIRKSTGSSNGECHGLVPKARIRAPHALWPVTYANEYCAQWQLSWDFEPEDLEVPTGET
jgi:hypothetical protein